MTGPRSEEPSDGSEWAADPSGQPPSFEPPVPPPPYGPGTNPPPYGPGPNPPPYGPGPNPPPYGPGPNPPPYGAGPNPPMPGQASAAGPGGTGGFVNSFGTRADIYGILSSVAGGLSILCCACAGLGGGGVYFVTLPLSIAAFVFGYLHLQRIKQGRATNRSLAILGITLGVIGVVIAICFGIGSVGRDYNRDIR